MAQIARDSPRESQVTRGRKRGRKPKIPLMEQVELAYGHLHNLDWLQECGLASLTAVQERVQRHHTMPEAQALRGLLTESALRVIEDIKQVPSMVSLKVFLERYLQGKKVTEIAKELRVSREWCSRSYRKEAFRLAGIQFVRSVSVGQ